MGNYIIRFVWCGRWTERGVSKHLCVLAGDLDIDIFFQENAQIGQKITLGEQIVAGLKRLGW